MNKLVIPDYNFDQTLLGGQAFNWDLIIDPQTGHKIFYGTTQEKVIKLEIVNELDGEILWQTYPQNDDYEFIKKYFRLNIDYKNILKKINKDEHVSKAMQHFPNLRLLSQDFDQTTLSFIISSFNSIKAIRTRINKMKVDLGEKVALDGQIFHLFPKTQAIADARVDLLMSHSLGYRAKYIKEAANLILHGDLSNKLQGLDEATTRLELQKLPGVGDKVSDCIMIFSLEFDNLTPLDVWGRRVFTHLYDLDEDMKYADVRKWLNEYFDGHAAWAGQFLFEWYRTNYTIKALQHS